MREVFWFGRSSCVPNNLGVLDFYCSTSPWLTNEGWYEMLRGYYNASILDEQDPLTSMFLWLYLPDFTNQGRMGTISYIPAAN